MNTKKQFLLTAAIISLAPCFAWGQLAGTTPVTTGGPSVVPTLELTNPGTFLAQTSISSTFLDFLPGGGFLVAGATIQEALFRNSSGGVDFYFQLQTPVPGQSSTDPIVKFFAGDFGSYATSVGYRPDGTALNAAGASGFALGTVAPTTAERMLDTTGFSEHHNAIFFELPGVFGGLNSDVLVVSTNASSFTTIGDLGFFPADGNGFTDRDISLYSPSGASIVAAPETGATALLLALGVVGLFGVERMIRSRTMLQAQTLR